MTTSNHEVYGYHVKYDGYQLFHKVEIRLMSRINQGITTLMTNFLVH